MKDQYTTNHDAVRAWVRSRDGFPAVVAGTTRNEDGMPSAVEIGFDEGHPDLERISWEDFFSWFEYHNLALRYNDHVEDGLRSFEFVDRQRVADVLSLDTQEMDSGDLDVRNENTIPDAP